MEEQRISVWRVMSASSAVSIRNLFSAVPAWVWLAQSLITSLFTMSFFALMADFAGNPDVSVSYVVVGNAVQSVAMVSVYAVANIPGIEKHVGTLSALMTSPANLFHIFIGMAAFQILAGFMAVAVSFIYAAFIFGVSFSMVSLPLLALTVIATSVSMSGLGMMVGCIGLYLRSSMIMANIVTYIGLVICGVNFPLSYLPDWILPISYSLPLTHAVDITRMLLDGAGMAEISGPLLIMLAIGALMFVVSYGIFKGFEWMVRRSGRTDSF